MAENKWATGLFHPYNWSYFTLLITYLVGGPPCTIGEGNDYSRDKDGCTPNSVAMVFMGVF